MIYSAFLHLTDKDIAALELEVGEVRQVIHDAFVAYSAGELHTAPKASIRIGPGHAFQSLMAVDARKQVAAVKWIAVVPPSDMPALNINASILLSDTASGRLRCIMDGRRATVLRTAGMTAAAARYLARKDSATIGFIGAGAQAEGHLAALAALLPSLKAVHVNSGASNSATRFADRCRKLGFSARVGDVREILAQSDIVVTTVPLKPDFEPFIDAAWVRPGTFVAAVDLGRSWKHEGLSAFDITAIDEDAMRHHAEPGRFIPALDYAQATLADLVSGRHAGRTGPQQRTILFSGGSAVADLALATLIYERAQAAGLGTQLPS